MTRSPSASISPRAAYLKNLSRGASDYSSPDRRRVSVSARRLALDGDLRAVSRALGEESAVSPAEAAEAARRLAAAAAVADAAAEARLRRREQTHALKATYRALRHRLRSWRQTASVARLVRFCATRWRGKAAAGAATRARKLRLAARFHRRGVEDKHLRALLFWRDEAAIARGCDALAAIVCAGRSERRFRDAFVAWKSRASVRASAREMRAEKSAKTRARAFGAWRVHANRSATSRAKALAFWRAKALRDLRAYAVAWSDAACSSRHDEHRRAKGAFAIWRRRATAAKNAKYALHRYVSSFLPSRRKARVFNAWAGVAKYRAYFASEVAKELVAEMSLAKTLRRCAARNLARRWIRRWHAVTRFAHLRALGHWAAWTAAKTLGAWRGSAIGGRRHRERRAAAEALGAVVRHQRVVRHATANGARFALVPEGALTPSPLSRRGRAKRRGATNDAFERAARENETTGDERDVEGGVASHAEASASTRKGKPPAAGKGREGGARSANKPPRADPSSARTPPAPRSPLARRAASLAAATESAVAYARDASTPRRMAERVGAASARPPPSGGRDAGGNAPRGESPPPGLRAPLWEAPDLASALRELAPAVYRERAGTRASDGGSTRRTFGSNAVEDASGAFGSPEWPAEAEDSSSEDSSEAVSSSDDDDDATPIDRLVRLARGRGERKARGGGGVRVDE